MVLIKIIRLINVNSLHQYVLFILIILMCVISSCFDDWWSIYTHCSCVWNFVPWVILFHNRQAHGLLPFLTIILWSLSQITSCERSNISMLGYVFQLQPQGNTFRLPLLFVLCVHSCLTYLESISFAWSLGVFLLRVEMDLLNMDTQIYIRLTLSVNDR